jgi:hypothetical protein
MFPESIKVLFDLLRVLWALQRRRGLIVRGGCEIYRDHNCLEDQRLYWLANPYSTPEKVHISLQSLSYGSSGWAIKMDCDELTPGPGSFDGWMKLRDTRL